MSKRNRNAQLAKDTILVAGVTKHLDAGQTIVIAGKTYTAAEFIAALQARVDLGQSILKARAAWRSLLDTGQAELAQTKPFADNARQVLLAMFAGNSDALADMGLAPRKPPRMRTAADKLAAALKAKATREARHTLGKRQKQAITGEAPTNEGGDHPVTSGSQANGASPVPVAPG